MTRIAVVGASGRMGRGLIRLISQADDLELAAAVVSPQSDDAGADAGALAGIGEIGVICGTQFKDAELVVDFSTPDSMRIALERCVSEKIPFVSGTTGISDAHRQELDESAQSIPVLWAANMSLGMQLCYELVGRAAAALAGRADIEIIEAHHRHKKDAPSGTALALGRAAAEGAGRDFDDCVNPGRSGPDVARQSGEIGISAVRGGDIVGDHSVLFAMDGELITIAHRATDRSVFLRGALAAARFLVDQKPGRYELRDVLGL